MNIGELLPIWSIIPFIGMLLSIALFPIINCNFWEKNKLKITLAWSALFLIPFYYVFGWECTSIELIDSIVLDYIPFLTLLFGLFVVSGGIHIKGTFVGNPKTNTILLFIGTLLASWIGTTGAAMLLIRPLIRANLWRKHRKHIIIFFIFLVANIGGCLSPIGDPPLFLGYLRGVPFFWTLEHIWPLLLLNSIILLLVFYFIDSKQIKREDTEHLENLELQEKVGLKIPFKIEGGINFVFLLIIIFAVILNGLIPKLNTFIDPSTEKIFGIDIGFGKKLGIEYFIQIALILFASLLSWVFTQKRIRKSNDFEWEPITEVAKLFFGIFITMIPALALLSEHGSDIGIDTTFGFFWTTGALSSFLDNSPTYVVFLTTAGALNYTGIDAVITTVGQVAPQILLAISAGAVFMGAITYIGNAPNFMIKLIAERVNIKMPSFFGYMGWSCAILLPLFMLDTLVFFL